MPKKFALFYASIATLCLCMTSVLGWRQHRGEKYKKESNASSSNSDDRKPVYWDLEDYNSWNLPFAKTVQIVGR